jgi:hypothetical protein
VIMSAGSHVITAGSAGMYLSAAAAGSCHQFR